MQTGWFASGVMFEDGVVDHGSEDSEVERRRRTNTAIKASNPAAPPQMSRVVDVLFDLEAVFEDSFCELLFSEF